MFSLLLLILFFQLEDYSLSGCKFSVNSFKGSSAVVVCYSSSFVNECSRKREREKEVA